MKNPTPNFVDVMKVIDTGSLQAKIDLLQGAWRERSNSDRSAGAC